MRKEKSVGLKFAAWKDYKNGFGSVKEGGQFGKVGHVTRRWRKIMPPIPASSTRLPPGRERPPARREEGSRVINMTAMKAYGVISASAVSR